MTTQLVVLIEGRNGTKFEECMKTADGIGDQRNSTRAHNSTQRHMQTIMFPHVVRNNENQALSPGNKTFFLHVELLAIIISKSKIDTNKYSS